MFLAIALVPVLTVVALTGLGLKPHTAHAGAVGSILTLDMGPTPPTANDGSVGSVEATVTVETGDTFTVEVEATNIPDPGIVGYTARLDWSAANTQLELLSALDQSGFPSVGAGTTIDNVAGTVHMAYQDNADAFCSNPGGNKGATSLVLFTATFEGAAAGLNLNLTFGTGDTLIQLCDGVEGWPYSHNPGQVTVQALAGPVGGITELAGAASPSARRSDGRGFSVGAVAAIAVSRAAAAALAAGAARLARRRDRA